MSRQSGALRFTFCRCCHAVIDAGARGMWMECEHGPHVDLVEVMPVAAHERLMTNRCACRVQCGDVPEEVDDSGICKGLPR